MPATKARLRCQTLPTLMIGFEWSSRRCRPRAGARLLNHLHRPDRCWAHVHRGPEIPTHIPSLGSTKPISLAFVDDVIQAPSRAVAFFSHSFTQQQSTEAEAGSYPNFRGLLVIANDRPIRSHAVSRSHIAVAKLHDIEVEYLSGRRQLHFARNQVSEPDHVGIPLPGQLIGLYTVAISAVGVVAKIRTVPKLIDVCLLGSSKQLVVLRNR